MTVEGECLFQQRGRHPDDGSEQQVLRLPTQLRAIPNGEHLFDRQYSMILMAEFYLAWISS